MLSNVNAAYIGLHKYTLAWKLLPPAISVLLSLNNPTWANRCVQQQIVHDTQAPNTGYLEKLPVLVSGKLSHPPDFELYYNSQQMLAW